MKEKTSKRRVICVLSLREPVVVIDVEFEDYVRRSDIEEALVEELFPRTVDGAVPVGYLFEWLVQYRCFDSES